MLIVLSLYAVLLWLVFGKFKLLPWNTTWKVVTGTIGLIIALVVIGALNYLTPSGRVTVQGATIEVTPNVSGTVIEVAVAPNAPVAADDLLFRIDPEPFAAEVARLEAALVEAESAAAQLVTDLAAAEADIDALEAQLVFGIQRRDDIMELTERGASTEFQMQEAVSTIAQLEASIRGAEERRRGLEIRIAAQVDGEDTTVAQTRASLAQAKWELAQTEVRATTGGTVTALALRAGDRVTPLRSAIAFVPEEERAMTGVFSQASSHAFAVGQEIEVALAALPGSSFTTEVIAILPGTGEGTLSTSGDLPGLQELVGGGSFAVRLALPADLPANAKALGTTGTALLVTENAGPIEPLARILFWLAKQFNYL